LIEIAAALSRLAMTAEACLVARGKCRGASHIRRLSRLRLKRSREWKMMWVSSRESRSA